MRRLTLAAAVLASLALTACGGEDDEGATMRPGSNCLSCHTGSGEAPRFTIAGTVYTGGNSTSGLAGATVTITPASGSPFTLTTNSVGNFYTSQSFGASYTATVAANGHTNTMSGAQSNGGCGACHAPGGSSVARVHTGTCGNCH